MEDINVQLHKFVKKERPNDVYNILRNHRNDIKEEDLYKAFLHSIHMNQYKILTYFFSFGIDLIIAKKYNGNITVLIEALYNPELSTIQLILSRPDCEPEADEQTALINAADEAKYEICKLLLLTGKCDPYSVRKDGISAYSIVKESFYADKFIKLFEKSEFIPKFEILGQGIEGCVIYPAFNGDNNSVSKLSGEISTLEHEYYIYQQLPRGGPLHKNEDKSPYFDKDKILLIPLENKDKMDSSNVCRCVNYYSPDFQLIMPKFTGKTIDEIFDEEIITIEKWYKLMIALIIFRNEIKLLKDNYEFTHGDLNITNIIYENDRLMMFDFGFSFFGKIPYKDYYVDDFFNLNKIFIQMISDGLSFKILDERLIMCRTHNVSLPEDTSIIKFDGYRYDLDLIIDFILEDCEFLDGNLYFK